MANYNSYDGRPDTGSGAGGVGFVGGGIGGGGLGMGGMGMAIGLGDGTDGSGFRGRGRPLHRRPVTDYGTSVAKFVNMRMMGWRGGHGGNHMRPGASWVIDVSV